MKRYLNALFFCVFILFFAGCEGCQDSISEGDMGDDGLGSSDMHVPDSGPPSFKVCYERCFNEDEPQNMLSQCKNECEKSVNSDQCKSHCDKFVKQRQTFKQLECRSKCFEDDDQDGIPNSIDECEGSTKSVTWNGCPDSDSDGVPDNKDKCANSKKGENINVDGCKFTPLCHEGDCSTSVPQCGTQEECARSSEHPVLKKIPQKVREDWVKRELSKKSAPLTCPEVKSAPSQPHLNLPLKGITPIEVGRIRVIFQNDKIIEGPSHRLEFDWNPVANACEPLTYAVFIESYHCHKVSGLIESVSYHNRGWCKWEPVTYVSNIKDTQFSYDFEIGKHLVNIHKAFKAELHYTTPQDGPFTMSFQPAWLRARVLSIDGNGAASASGMHAEQRYFVFYNPRFTRPEDLINLPIGP